MSHLTSKGKLQLADLGPHFIWLPVEGTAHIREVTLTLNNHGKKIPRVHAPWLAF